MESELVITGRGPGKQYIRDQFHITALKDINLDVHKSEFVALMGPSGSGKSTLLHLIAAMDRPTSGEMRVLGEDIRKLSDRQLAPWRNAYVGFVFQSFNLIPVLTALENVELPLKLTHLKKKERLEHARPHCVWLVWKTGSITTRGSSPAARSSASRSLARLQRIPI